MERVRIFYGCEVPRLEEQVNNWLESMYNKIKITRVMYAAGVRAANEVFLTIVIFYSKKK